MYMCLREMCIYDSWAGVCMYSNKLQINKAFGICKGLNLFLGCLSICSTLVNVIH